METWTVEVPGVVAVPRRGFFGLAALAMLAGASAPLRAEGVCSLALVEEEDEVSAAMDALSRRFFLALTTGGPADVEVVLWQPREFLFVDRGRLHRGAAVLFDPRHVCEPVASWPESPWGAPATTIALGDGVAVTARPGPPLPEDGARMRRLDVLVGRRAPDGWRAVALIVAQVATDG